jgi:hypothetical protein
MIKPRRMRWAGHVAQIREKSKIKDVGGEGRMKETSRKP